MVSMRSKHPVFARGDIRLLRPSNHRVFAFTRSLDDETVLVVCNFSSLSQAVNVELVGHDGSKPIELISRTEFPPVEGAQYALTLNPHGYFILKL